jgi:hypothetical protein
MTPSDLKGSLPQDVQRIHEVRILVEPTVGDRWRIRINLDAYPVRVGCPPPGLVIEVEGPDETVVEGLALRLHHFLRPGTRRLHALALVALTLPVWAGSLLMAIYIVNGLRVGHIWMTLPTILVVASLVGLYWAAPSLELLPPGVRPRLRRFGGVLYAVLLGVLVYWITTGITALVGQATTRF